MLNKFWLKQFQASLLPTRHLQLTAIIVSDHTALQRSFLYVELPLQLLQKVQIDSQVKKEHRKLTKSGVIFQIKRPDFGDGIYRTTCSQFNSYFTIILQTRQ